MTVEEKYKNSLREACNEMRMDYFPQVEASELLFRVITLEDIYLPLSLAEGYYNPNRYEPDSQDIEVIMQMIDDKIKALEEMSSENDGKSKDEQTDNTFQLPDTNERASEGESAHRILIEADPGSGKTTFCKRLVLAFLNKDEEFFQKYTSENNLTFDIDDLPIFLSCRCISEFSIDELNSLDFTRIMYKICARDFGSHFSGISESDFLEMVSSKGQRKICIILDGWDEILDIDRAVFFRERLKQYVNAHPLESFIITSRYSYIVPELGSISTKRFRICALSEDDIRTFCQKWYETILNPNQNRYNNYEIFTNQVLSSKDNQIRHMMHNPLELSMLMTVSKNDGLLPENKADLFDKLVDLHIFWNTNKSNATLSQKTVRVLLAYIASYLTKRDSLVCNEELLINIINQAIEELDYVFSEDISCVDSRNIAKELSHTGILTKTYNGNMYSFSESRYVNHRLMQEYLTAYAISSQYSDREYNSMLPSEIFDDKYTLRRWKEVITFVVLMKNGRMRQDIINSLINKCKTDKENDYYYSNLLFSFILQKAEITTVDKHRIYDSIFQNQITDRQIDYIVDLVNGNSKTANDFIKHISEKFTNSIENGKIEYVYPYALIEATKALNDGISSFDFAYKLLLSGDSRDIYAGMRLFIILSWCKYSGISNVFISFFSRFKLTPNMIVRFKALLKNEKYSLEAAKCIREIIVAGFVPYYKFFDVSVLNDTCNNLCKSELKEVNEIILSLAPVFSSHFQEYRDFDCEVKNRYKAILDENIKENKFDDIVFYYSICVAIGCFSIDAREKIWEEIIKVYNEPNSSGIGKAWFSQLNEKYLNILKSRIFVHFKLPKKVKMNVESWKLTEKSKILARYQSDRGDYELRIKLPNKELCEEANSFLAQELQDSFVTYNNLAYLLRRHEISEAFFVSKDYCALTPNILLTNGVRSFDSFSIINYALYISGIYKNTMGDYLVGKNFINTVHRFLDKYLFNWRDVANWWIFHSVMNDEYEGLAVIVWLNDLDLLDLSRMNSETLKYIASRLAYFCEEEDFSILHNKIQENLLRETNEY